MLNTVNHGLMARSQNRTAVATRQTVPAFKGGIEKVAVQAADGFVTKAAAELGEIKFVDRARKALMAGEPGRASILYKKAIPQVVKKFQNEAEKVALFFTEVSQALFSGAGKLLDESTQLAKGSTELANRAVVIAENKGDDVAKAGTKVIKELTEKNADQVCHSLIGTPEAQQEFAQGIIKSAAPKIIEQNELYQLKVASDAAKNKAELEALQVQMKLEQMKQMMQPEKPHGEFGFNIADAK
ncbi:MAG: hypothetical protein WCK67_02870 [bacterium]